MARTRSYSPSSKPGSTVSCARRSIFSCEIVEQLPGSITLSIIGAKASAVFANEAGGHRWQRVPPNEKRGRVHTSTVTVAVLEEDVAADFDLGPVRIETIRGPGSGGQHKNTSDTCVVATHLETGITARCDSRSQDQNKKTAMAVLRARVANRYASVQRADRASRRREQVGTGMRGDKRRTIRVRDGRVHDHVTGRRWNLKRYLEGDWR